jgi:DNA-binding response OmpR family regulator
MGACAEAAAASAAELCLGRFLAPHPTSEYLGRVSKRTRILVVDDAEPVRTILLHTLRLSGFDAFEAISGPDAWRAAHEVPFDIAIVDQWMPEMTGAELIERFRRSEDVRVRSMAIIGLSGRPGSERELLAAGALSFLPKPFGAAQLKAALRAALDACAPITSSAA